MLDGCFYVTSDGGSMWWIIDNRLRAANSAFMTDNKCALPNQANWSVPFWNGKRKRKKGVHRQKLWYCVNTLLCVTTMQNHCYELAQKIKLDIFHTFMILDWLATFFSPKWLSKVSRTLRKYIGSVYAGVQVTQRFVCERANKWNNGKWSMVEP